ncbi:MAG: cytochrome c assembly protein [Chitinophagaceae bacterium]|nr:MAG: cytochrome c assembly protein [Chitinophagaceae bacterium]
MDKYFGETLLPGQLGHFFIILSLVASIVACFAFFRATRAGIEPAAAQWKKLARYAFITQAVSVLAIFSLLFFIIYNHLFEYRYAWQHSSRSLEFKYLLACFWEGQEGSFLLWSLWHCILGLVLIRTSGKWETPVMTIISFVQVCIATMVMGIYFGDFRLGSNPFLLMRDSGLYDNAPFMHIGGDLAQGIRPDYLSFIKDGNDLNPLLQNRWMVIHPPVLFLGFASTIVPFAFAISGLWLKRFTEWTKAAMPWTLFSVAVFGVGIMMGAWWAYESLTFGGYWAWDPVENASLVPWLILVSGVHTLLIFNSTGHSLRATYLFLLLGFAFVIYSTYLTRSGVLGEASVHSFTGDGMGYQLIFFLVILVLPSLLLYILRYKQIPAIRKEEQTSSREFWMFIGSLIFFFSALIIIGKTSVPVFNKIFGSSVAAPEDAEFAYNQIQIFVAIFIGILTAVTQYLKYKSTTGKSFLKKIAIPTVVAAIVAALVLTFGDINYSRQSYGFLIQIWVAVTCAIYAIIANAAYIWLGVRGKLGLSGGSIAHVGFGMVLLGILLSSAKKEILSYNTSGIPKDFFGKNSKEKPGENLTLVKGIAMKMGKFDVTYLGDSAHPKKQQWYFNIHFKSRTDNEEFTLRPNAFVNYKGNEGLMANPDSKHYPGHDIFTYVSALPNKEKVMDTASFSSNKVAVGDSIFYSQGVLVLESLTSRDNLPIDGFKPGDQGTVAKLRAFSFNKSSYAAQPLLIQAGGQQLSMPDTIMPLSLIVKINSTDGQTADIGVKESDAILEFVTLKAYKFPFINLLWLGIVVTALGTFMSMARRIRVNRLSKES